jgi:hypothetical protein
MHLLKWFNVNHTLIILLKTSQVCHVIPVFAYKLWKEYILIVLLIFPLIMLNHKNDLFCCGYCFICELGIFSCIQATNLMQGSYEKSMNLETKAWKSLCFTKCVCQCVYKSFNCICGYYSYRVWIFRFFEKLVRVTWKDKQEMTIRRFRVEVFRFHLLLNS